jgi:hypothetical protein
LLIATLRPWIPAFAGMTKVRMAFQAGELTT